MKDMDSKKFMEGASASINKTMKDIESILEGSKLELKGPKREELRSVLKNSFNEISIDWLKHGFKGGHRISQNKFMKNKKFPEEISCTITRNFPIRKKGEELKITLKSKISNKTNT